jgi:predicted protein tyrosine phosphatase
MTIMRNGRPTIIDTISTRTIEAIISRDEIQCAIHQNILDKENLVLISIGEPGEGYKHSILTQEEIKGFKDVLQLEFWDIEEDFGNYKIITDDQAKMIQDFIIKNKDERFIINCKAGKSRSAAVGLSIEYITRDKYLIPNYSHFTSQILKHERYTPNMTVFNKIISGLD